MKRNFQTAALFLSALLVCCGSKSSNPPSPEPGETHTFALSATVDSATQFSAPASVSINDLDTSRHLIDIKGTTDGYTIEIYFFCPTAVTSPLTLGPRSPGFVTGKYYPGSVQGAEFWVSSDTASVTVDSFFVGPTDTTLAVEFSFTATGGLGVQSVKHITAGTVVKN
jgi:hypothetical protein